MQTHYPPRQVLLHRHPHARHPLPPLALRICPNTRTSQCTSTACHSHLPQTRLHWRPPSPAIQTTPLRRFTANPSAYPKSCPTSGSLPSQNNGTKWTRFESRKQTRTRWRPWRVPPFYASFRGQNSQRCGCRLRHLHPQCWTANLKHSTSPLGRFQLGWSCWRQHPPPFVWFLHKDGARRMECNVRRSSL